MSIRIYSTLKKSGTVLIEKQDDAIPAQKEGLLFSEPEFTLTTKHLSEVPSAFRELESYIARGYFAAGYVAYEAGWAFEDRLTSQCAETYSFPLLWFGLYRSCEQVDLNRIITLSDLPVRRCHPHLSIMRRNYYEKDIMAIKDLIEQGEIYQMNYTWQAELSQIIDPLALFFELRQSHPVPYSAWVMTDEIVALSLSPELFFCKNGDEITVRPMKGTKTRGSSPLEDRAQRQALETSEKDRAENLMIVDLLRNDLNRICENGSVCVPRLFTVEEYPSLFQMTSTIKGTLSEKISFVDIFSSLFPCGSVTGAPKVRAMELIRNIEKEPRGIYTGSIGFISPRGDAFFNVAIRTISIGEKGARLGVGGGIVWDSDPGSEYEECLLKMKFVAGDDDFALIETILCECGKLPLLKRHCSRMIHSASYFKIPADEDKFCRAVSNYCASLDHDEAFKIRVLCDRWGGIVIEHERLDLFPRNNPCRAGMAGMRVDSKDPLLGHKTKSRMFRDDLLRRARMRGLDEVFFFNERGELTEGCISNVFIKKDGVFFTPPLLCGVLPGVMRSYILDNEPTAEERILTLHDIIEADEVFICNALRGMHKVMFEKTVI